VSEINPEKPGTPGFFCGYGKGSQATAIPRAQASKHFE
jgi:hypothetical protein